MNNDSEIIQLLKSGDEQAVKLIFDKYYDNLCLYAESIVKDAYIAEEVVENLFIWFWINAKDANIQTSLKCYLYRSVHNNCLKYIEKLKKERKLIDRMPYYYEDKELLHPLTPDYPVSNLIIRELEEKAAAIIETLPEQCKEIYMLNRYENLSYSETATKLNISVSTVKTQMSRAFQRFREELKEYIPLIIMLFLFR